MANLVFLCLLLQEKEIKEAFSSTLSKLRDVESGDSLPPYNEIVGLISPIEQVFEDIAEWNRCCLLGLPLPDWMVPEKVEATRREIEKRVRNGT